MENNEQKTRAAWIERSSAQNVAIADQMLGIINACAKNSYQLRYNQGFIGLTINGKPSNFTTVVPQKKKTVIRIFVGQDKSFDTILEEKFAGKWSYNSDAHKGSYFIDIIPGDNMEYLKTLLTAAEEQFGKRKEKTDGCKTAGNDVLTSCDDCDKFSEGLSKVEKKHKYGFIDKSGNVVIPVEFNNAGSFKEGLAKVSKDGKWDRDGIYSGGKWGFIDKTGNVVIPMEYDKSGDFSDGMAKVEMDDECGFIDKTGNVVIPLEYEDAGSFCDGLAWVEKDDKYGFIDKSGKMVVPLEYDYAYEFSDGLACVEKDDLYGFIDKSGNIVVPLKYESANNFSDGLALVWIDDKYGFIDKTGKEVIPLEYDDANDFNDGLARVEKDEKCIFIDTTGKEVFPIEYDNAWDFSGGLARVEKDDMYGFIDKNGKLVIPLEYEDTDDFSDGLAWVEKDDKIGFIDKTGKLVLGWYGSKDPDTKNASVSKAVPEESCGEKKEFRVEIELSQAYILHFLENNDNGIFEWSDWESYYEENSDNQEYLPDIIPIMDNCGEIKVYDENDEVVFESDDLENIIRKQYLCIPSDPENFEDYDNDDNPLLKSIKNPQKVCDQLNEDIAAEQDRLKEGVSYYCWAEQCNMYKNSFTVEDSKFDITKLHFAQFADGQYEGIFDEVIDSEDVTAIGRIIYNDELISEYEGADWMTRDSHLYAADYEDGYVEVEEKELD